MHISRNRISLLVASLMLLGMLGILPLNAVHAQSGGTSQLTIVSQDTNGNAINGYYTVLYQGGSIVATQYSPTSFTLIDGQSYVVQADSYGSCYFQNWEMGNTAASMPISITTDTQIIAIYNCNAPFVSSLNVFSQDQNGNSIHGFAITLFDSSGNQVSTSYTTGTLLTTAGQSYSVQVASSFAGCAFVQWSDGSTANPISFTASTGPATLTAVYNCPNSGSNPGSPSIYVNSIDQNGNTIAGYYTVQYDSSGNVLATAFTPSTFSLSLGQTYNIEVESYGNCTFAHWSGGATSDPLTFTAYASYSFTAVYTCNEA